MTGASIETTLELWASWLRAVKARTRVLFTQERGGVGGTISGWAAWRRAAQDWLDSGRGGGRSGAVAPAGDPWPWPVGCGRASRHRARLFARDARCGRCGACHRRDRVPEARQGLLRGKPPIYRLGGQDHELPDWGVRAYVSRHGHAFIDRALYLSKAWTSDPARMAAAHVPTGTAFATKPALAVQMITRAIAADVPFSWVAADSVYGVGDIEQALRRAGKGYVLGVNANHHFGSWAGKPPVAGTADEIAQSLDLSAWAAAVGGRGNQGRQTARLGLSRTRRPRGVRI